MRARPLLGPALVLAGGLGLLLASLLTWYAVDLERIPVGPAFAGAYARQNRLALAADAWEPFGTASDLLLLAVIAAAVTLGVLGLAGGAADRRLARGALGAGGAGTVLVLVHVLARPEPAEIVVLRAGAWLGLLCCLVLLAGALLWWDRLRSADRSGAPAPR